MIDNISAKNIKLKKISEASPGAEAWGIFFKDTRLRRKAPSLGSFIPEHGGSGNSETSLKYIVFLLIIFLALMLGWGLQNVNVIKEVRAQNCDCDVGCSVGFVCDFCSLAGDRGPATWNCVGGCCNRPDWCAGVGACFSDGYKDTDRIGCASDPTLCGGPTPTRRPTETPHPPPPPPPPTEVPPPEFLTPFPEPYVPCNEVRDPEFHSLRPYQASPCNQDIEDVALYCGNDFYLTDNITIHKIFEPPLYSGNYFFEGNPIEPNPPDSPSSLFACTYCAQGNICVPRDPPCVPDIGCRSNADCTVPECIDNGDGTETCAFNVSRERHIAIDLLGSYLPIMGNTQLVVNSQNHEPEDPLQGRLDDPLKVNEYVSWYLNGVIGRAEYDSLDMADEHDVRRLIDFSGPLKKLLAFNLQHLIRNEEIDDAQRSISSKCNPDQVNPSDPDCIRHNQIAVCGESSLGTIGDIFNIGTIRPKECYKGDGSSAEKTGTEVFRLQDWEGDLSIWNTAIDNGLVDIIVGLLPPVPREIIDNSIRHHWNSRKPPLPWENDPFAKPERRMTALEYRKYYNEWRGKTCVIVPILNLLFCFDNILVPNKWADLFPYVPFSSTEDRKGSVEIADYSVQPASGDNFIIIDSSITNQKPAELFFAHMQESFELADILQQVFSYQEANLDAGPEDSIDPYQTYCDITQIRSNPGDNLFAGEISATVNYTAQVSCTFTIPGEGRLCVAAGGTCAPSNYYCDTYFGPVDCPENLICGVGCSAPPTNTFCEQHIYGAECYPESWRPCNNEQFSGGPVQFCPTGYVCAQSCDRPPDEPPTVTETCSNDVFVSFKTVTKTPLAEEVWSKLVAGPAGVFRRMFPQIEDDKGRPLRALWALPAATSVVFSSPDANIIPGSPGTGRTSDQAELYFPYIGGIHEYFLKCIQKTLRPKGFGEGCISPPEITPPPTGGTCPAVADSAIPAKYQGRMKENFLRLADIWSASCPGEKNNLAKECYNYVVSESVKAGVNPAFSLTIWLNESGASNYCSGATQDFGIKIAALERNIVTQLAAFLQLPKSAEYLACQSACSGSCDDMFAFLDRFRDGNCNLVQNNSNPGWVYYNNVKNFTWQVVTEPLGICVDGNRFGISWPTDNSCP